MRKALGSNPSVSISLLWALGSRLRWRALLSHRKAVSASDDRHEPLTSSAHSRCANVLGRPDANFVFLAIVNQWAHGVVVSHPLRMRKALGSNPSVSRLDEFERSIPLCGWRIGLARLR